MKKRLQNTTNKLIPIGVILVLLLIWQLISFIGWIPNYMLPSPMNVMKAFLSDVPLLMEHTRVTLSEASLGL
ncbi:MAG: ABC transporter permease, partial [Acetivibrio sp.]